MFGVSQTIRQLLTRTGRSPEYQKTTRNEMSEFVDALVEYREHYVAQYQQAVVEYREKYQPGGPEVLLEVGGREHLPPLFRLYRIDLASGAVDPPNLTDFNLNELPSGITTTYTIEGVDIELSPIAWNGVEITGPVFDPTSPAFEAWMTAWIDPDETKDSDEYGLGAYVHSVTYPEEIGDDQATFSVDFGTAGPDSFIELIGVLSGFGATYLKVGSSWLASESE